MADNEHLNDDVTADATDAENVPERDKNLGALADDIAHPFDQTNGIVEGLEGDADEPENQNESATPGPGIVAAPAPGVGGAFGGVPLPGPGAKHRNSDTDDAQGA